MTLFSDRLASAMKQQNLTQKDLAQKSGVTESAISYYVKGERTPSGDVLVRLAQALNETTDYLLGRTDKIEGDGKLQILQRNLGKLDQERLKKAENILNAVFDDIFNAKFDDDDGED